MEPSFKKKRRGKKKTRKEQKSKSKSMVFLFIVTHSAFPLLGKKRVSGKGSSQRE